ncbi:MULTISPECIES: ribosome silencing factor [unclassified Saccharibacter]|uniref:ribosome silencing factor n=1 Tax=unclassified Saccharibacter TaxID=2648722 RepID=UPI0013273A3E|nr:MULTISPECIES: ribosome silencing factor [unclassified Saccharibacter]MXV36349.1 ribosome silencing factor [Saccharibacter sp. EH611]MXV57511.1 ribosome silencing factor [Saccharibacter sp. EH70]MXV65182.1 ribosome silencing factor [Saccharibacter sp. EH60]
MNTSPIQTDLSPEEALTRTLEVIAESLNEDKAENIVTLDLVGRAGFADRMIIASGVAERQIAAMAQHIERRLKEENLARVRVEGDQNSDWVLLDAGDVIVHLFMPESRELYALERMWGSDFDQADEEVTVGQSSSTQH